MINKLIIALILLCTSASLAQTTQVTGTITDTAGSSYANGTYNIFLTDNAGNYLSSGVVWIGNSTPVAPLQFTGALDSTGTFSVPLARNAQIQAPSPATGTLWQFNICSQKPPSAGTSVYSSILIGTQQCLKYSTTVSGSTLNLSTQLSALAPSLYFFNALNGTCEIATGLCGASGGQVVPLAIDMTKPPCNVPSDHVTDITSAFNACLNLYTNSGAGAATYAFFLPRTNTAISSRGSCDYVASGTLVIPKTLYEPTIYGQTQGADLGSRICTTTTNTTGMLDNTDGATLRNLTFYGADGWVSTNTTTYVVTGTADGVRVCGPSTTLDHVAALYYSRHGLNMDSSQCFGGSTDFASADSTTLYAPFVDANQGNGINFAGGDGNLGFVINGSSTANQLFGFQDRSLYPATVIGLNTQANHNDPETPINPATLTSCSVTAGIMTCTCPSSCGVGVLDTATISGSSNSGYNQKYEFSPVVTASTSTFTMRTGDIGPNDGTSTSGGTVSYSPGGRIWAGDNVYGGCCYASTSGQGNWIQMYSEGNQPGPMVNEMVNVIGGGGTAGNTAFYYAGTGGFANTDSGYFSVLGATLAVGSPDAKITYQQVQNINPATRRLMCNIFRPSNGVAGGGGVDVGWSSQAGWCNGTTGGTTPEIVEMGRTNGAANTDGYWAFTMNDNFLTTASKTYFRLYDLAATTQPPGTVEFPNSNPVLFDATPQVNGVNVTAALSGTTGSIGGGALTAGTCATGTVTITGATSSMALIATPSNTAGPGAQFFVQAYLSAANTVTVAVCTDLAAGGTPTSTTYNVRAIP